MRSPSNAIPAIDSQAERLAALKSPKQKVAFISVFDKTGLEPLAKALVEDFGYVILSTGGTKKYLEERGIPAVESGDITGFGELLGGRVKSLHPSIFAAILAERAKADQPDYEMPEFLIDTVIVNLYPFEKERDEQAFNPSADPHHLLHFIDIGGSALIRAAAKNYLDVVILSDERQYGDYLCELKNGNGATSEAFRKKLAIEAFRRSVAYDSAIAAELSAGFSKDQALLPEQLTLSLCKIQGLRYGENPHQKAALYGIGTDQAPFKLLSGKELSFNNILDMASAWGLISEFSPAQNGSNQKQYACAVIKHNNPCGVAVSKQSLSDAYQTAFNVDPLSAFGGVVAFNNPVDADTAKLMKDVFLEVIIAPEFNQDAIEILSAKKNLRLVSQPLLQTEKTNSQSLFEYKQVAPNLLLAQFSDPSQPTAIDALVGNAQVTVASQAKPSQAQLADLAFAWKVVKHVKSNAIVLAKNGRTVGIGVGQTSRIGALENALKIACDEAKDAVLASDGFLPHEDNIHAAAQARVSAIIQPGGSIKDKDVVALADQNAMAMVMTGVREFKH
ncbi:MAG: bifunctional phosphoribosylaminoimidazolecarboxamide formyltransferase/IMP cyclohydrolase [Vampirovibrionales bacterium]|nr:bifunctional phosphoribosylaminoimidazolecarboxamide formyltransferase/IMP cyclohydrolase [Vampirovibrionales bacterium]